jgi:hypothetical protein
VSYVDGGYSIALSVLFLYAVALVLRRRRWERAMRVAERTMHAEHAEAAEHAEQAEVAEHPERIEAAKIAEVTQVIAHTEHAEEQTAPGARS